MTHDQEAKFDAPVGDVVDTGDYTAFLGNQNTLYYLERFRRFASGQATLSWNWAALFLTSAWLGYRKMWAALFGYFALNALTLPIYLAFPEALAAYMIAVNWILVPAYANRIYYAHCQTQIGKVSARVDDPALRHEELSRIGGVSIVTMMIAFILGLASQFSLSVAWRYALFGTFDLSTSAP